MNPPSDEDDVAKVTPLRRREPHLVGLPRIRDPLPAESAPFDPELEPSDVQLRRSRKRRTGAALASAARRLRAQITMPRVRSVFALATAIGCAAAVAVVTAVLTLGGRGRWDPYGQLLQRR